MNWNYISKQTIDWFYSSVSLGIVRMQIVSLNQPVECLCFFVVCGSVWSRFNEARSNPGWMKPVCSIRKKTRKMTTSNIQMGKVPPSIFGCVCTIFLLYTHVDGRNPAPVYLENIPFLIDVQHHPRCLFGISWPSTVSPRQTPIPSRERSHIPYQPTKTESMMFRTSHGRWDMFPRSLEINDMTTPTTVIFCGSFRGSFWA